MTRSRNRNRQNHSKGLLIAKHKSQIIDMVKKNQVVIIVGQTGSGKSTQVPQYLYQNREKIGLKPEGKIACLHPRTVAAMSLAGRVSQETNTHLGDLVGYQVRFYQECEQSARMVYMTAGFMLKLMTNLSIIKDYSVIIIDEAHERSVQSDLVIGQLKLIMKTNKDLRLVIMSATISVKEILVYYPEAVTINVTQEKDKVAIIYRPLTTNDYVATVCEVVQEILQKSKKGHLLVFLPSEDKVWRCIKLLGSLKSVDVLPLYGAMDGHDKMNVFRENGKRRKVVVATNIAETSLTIDGVDFVIDAGFVKRVCFDCENRVERWMTERVSEAEAEQRKGRTGRTGNRRGTCYRLYEPFSYREELSPSLGRFMDDLEARYSLAELRVVAVHRDELHDKIDADASAAGDDVSGTIKVEYLRTQPTDYASVEAVRGRLGALNIDGVASGNGRGTRNTDDGSVEAVCGRLGALNINKRSNVTGDGERRSPRIFGPESNIETVCGKIDAILAVHRPSKDAVSQWYPSPEIVRANLEGTVLTMKVAKINIDTFPFVTRPSAERLMQAVAHLKALSLLQDNGSVTPLGTKVARLPMDPAQGKVAVLAADTPGRDDVFIVLALLSSSLALLRRQSQNSRGRHRVFHRPMDGDLAMLVAIYEEAEAADFHYAWCQDNGVILAALKFANLIVRQLSRLLPWKFGGEFLRWQYSVDERLLWMKRAFLSGFFENLAVQVKKDFLMTDGKKCRLYMYSCVDKSIPIVMSLSNHTSQSPDQVIMKHCTVYDWTILESIDPRKWRIRANLWRDVMSFLASDHAQTTTGDQAH